MRQGRIQSAPAAGGGAMSLICGPSNTRVLVHITVDQGIGYVTDQQGAAPLTGIAVTPQMALILRVEDYGDIVHHALYGSNANGAAQFGFIEIQDTQSSISGSRAGVT
jgi:hypothetical protein